MLDRDPSFIRGMNQVLHDHLFPEQSELEEPEINENQRGRPPGAGRQWLSRCRRDRSGFEYVLGRGHSRGSRSGRGSGGSRAGRSSDSSVNRGSSSGIRKSLHFTLMLLIGMSVLTNLLSVILQELNRWT